MASVGREPEFVRRLEHLVFDYRHYILILFAVVTVLLGVVAARGLRIDTRFTKQLPLSHEYMRTYIQYQEEFGGANRVLIGVFANDGNMWTPGYLAALKAATDDVFFIPGVDRARVQSLWTPNTRYMEVVEGGIQAGDVIPSGFTASPAGIDEVRDNVLKAGIVGRLVANDFSGALVSAQLQEQDPASGRPVDLIRIGHSLEAIRAHIEGGDAKLGIESGHYRVAIIGFAKVVADIADGARAVIGFAFATVLLTLVSVWLYVRSLKVAAVAVFASLVAVTWQLGLLVLLGFGVDPLGILVPFVIFAIGVSHGVQKISAVCDAAEEGLDANHAARRTFRLLFVPAIVALLADLVGFVTILAIPVQVIREMAITASIGVAVVILTDLVLLPILISYLRFDSGYGNRVQRREALLAPVWRAMSRVSVRPVAGWVIVAALVLAIAGYYKGRQTPIGDTGAGVPELRTDSRYNADTRLITGRFAIGSDVLNVIAETKAQGCVDHDVMQSIDDFAWAMQNVEGVKSVMSLPTVAKIVSAGWNEGFLKWRSLPRDERALVQAQGRIDTSTGLLNRDCSVMPVALFLADHRAVTIERVVAAVKHYAATEPLAGVRFRLATGPVGVMAAQNEEVKAKEVPVLLYVFASVALMCLITFRSVTGKLLVMIPLALVSILAYAVMATVGIGLKVTTLPMVALGAGIGVDYGIYLYSRMLQFLRDGQSVRDAYLATLRVTGASIVCTGVTLALGVATWVVSPLKFQADVGLMLAFMFLVNMLAALILMPALAAYMVSAGDRYGGTGRTGP